MDSGFYFVYFNVDIKIALAHSGSKLDQGSRYSPRKGQALIEVHPLKWQGDMNDKYNNRSYQVISWQRLSESIYHIYKNEIGDGQIL